MKRNGTFQGRQRWLCHGCERSFVWRNVGSRLRQQRIWFERWIVIGSTVTQLARESGHSVSTIRRIIGYWLQRHPPDSSDLWTRCRCAIIDGTFVKRPKSILAIMNAVTHRLVYASYDVAERPRDLHALFQHLHEGGLSLKYATVDGNPAISQALRARWPQIVTQRCVVHVQRQGLSWCRRAPKRTDAKHLRALFLALTDVRTASEAMLFVRRVHDWEQRFGPTISASRPRGWVFPDLVRARSMLLKALPDLFHFVGHADVARSTNALEGYFSRLKEHYRRHRGLSPKNRTAYFRWYFHLVPK